MAATFPWKGLALAVIFCSSLPRTMTQNSGVGYFWQISDIHLDVNYSTNGDVQQMCHKVMNVKPSSDIGSYGDFLCDAPKVLVLSSIKAMKKFHPNPDFIVWTGDNAPHVHDPEPSWSTIYALQDNITSWLSDAFPNVSIFPSIGNHDVSPANQLPVDSQDVYKSYVEQGVGGWEEIMPNKTLDNFLQGGYYSYQLSPGLQLISLNTMLWMNSNKQVNGSDPDPGGQFAWLKNELQKFRDQKQKVIIIGHIPPGLSGEDVLKNATASATYKPRYNSGYAEVMMQYPDVVTSQMFGHIHRDMFGLMRAEDQGDVLNSYLVSTSVTPWSAPDNVTFVHPRAPNPSLRLYHYNKTDGTLLDYEQYYLNLTEANSDSKNDSALPWELLYSFQKAYDLPNITTATLQLLYHQLQTSPKTFGQYYRYSVANHVQEACGKDCRQVNLCTISFFGADTVRSCIERCASLDNATPTQALQLGCSSDLETSAAALTQGIPFLSVASLFALLLLPLLKH